MALANEVSRMSWSRLLDSWSQSLVLLDAAAFLSLDRLPITRFGSACRKTVFCGVLRCFVFSYLCSKLLIRSSEALCSSEALVLVIADLD